MQSPLTSPSRINVLGREVTMPLIMGYFISFSFSIPPTPRLPHPNISVSRAVRATGTRFRHHGIAMRGMERLNPVMYDTVMRE